MLSSTITQAITIARQAGGILLEHLGKVEIEYKGHADLVTAADRASEKFITEALRSAFPDHSIVAEEGTRRDAAGDYRWLIDPLDGTTNFAHRLPIFAVSMGLEYRGEVVAGVVYAPALQELFAAERGAGAFYNDRPMHVSTTARLEQGLIATGFPAHQRHKNPNIHLYHAVTLKSHGVRRLGSAALDLCYTAVGRFDGFWEFGLKPWDSAAGSAILTEAGGRISDLLGSPYTVDAPDLLASNGLIHEELQAVLAEVLNGRGPSLPDASHYLKSERS